MQRNLYPRIFLRKLASCGLLETISAEFHGDLEMKMHGGVIDRVAVWLKFCFFLFWVGDSSIRG